MKRPEKDCIIIANSKYPAANNEQASQNNLQIRILISNRTLQ